MDTLTIAVDVDDTIADLFAVVPKLYSALTGEHITRESFEYADWDHSKVVERPDVLLKLFEPWVYDFVLPITGAYLGIKEIRKMGHAVIFCTASIAVERKIEWLEYWNFIDTRKEVVVTSNKTLVRADMLIDDFVTNLINFPGETWVYPQPWNTGFGPRGDWSKIVKFVRGIA